MKTWLLHVIDQMIERTTPPSVRSAVPFVAEDSGLATKATSAVTSSVVANRLSSELGRTVSKNSFWAPTVQKSAKPLKLNKV